MTVRLPRRFPREDQDTFLERLIALLENIVDTVADQGVLTRNIAPRAVSSSNEIRSDLAGGSVSSKTELERFIKQVEPGQPLVIWFNGQVRGSESSGSGWAVTEVQLNILLNDANGNKITNELMNHRIVIPPNALNQQTIMASITHEVGDLENIEVVVEIQGVPVTPTSLGGTVGDTTLFNYNVVFRQLKR